MGSWIFLVALLAPLSIAAPPDPQYILIVPAVVQSNTTNEACVQLLNLNETVSVDVVLEYNVDRFPLWEGTVDKKHFSQCINFTVPPADSNPLAYIVFSAKGALISFHERRSVAVRNISTLVFVQTDKPVYKPDQKVMFRVVSMDKDFKPVNEMYPAIYIQDPQGNRIAQWLNQTPSFGILQLELVINQGALLGSYQIVVENPPNYNTYHWFTMEEYVLPKFKTDIKTPDRISAFDEEFQVHVSAHYTFGQPVQGTVQIRVCRHRYYDPRCNRDSNGICEAVSAQLDKDGSVSKTISTKAFRLYANMHTQRYFYVSLHAEAVVTEKGTGIQISKSNYISVYQARKTITLENVDPYYRRGIPLTGQMKVNDEDGAPLPNGLIFIEFDGEVVANYTTDNNGTAQFSIPTSHLFEPRYKLRAIYEPDQCTEYGWLENYKPEAVHYVQRYFSRTNSFVKIEPVLRELPCGKREAISVHYILNKVQNEELPSKVHFYYLIMTNGRIVDGGEHLVSIKAGRYSRFSIPLMIDQKAAPRAKLLVYTLHPHGELIADSISFEVEKCFRNKVSLQFSKKEALPASGIGLNLKAASNSFCALRAVDKSVLLLRPGEDLTPESVYSRLPYQELYGYYYNGLNLEDTPKEPCVELKNTFFDAQFYIPVNVTDDGNVYDVFRNLGLKVFTNSTLLKPVVCQSDFECKKISSDYPDNEPRIMDEAKVAFGAAAGGTSTLRTYFPETFFWQLHWVDSSGKANLSYTVPDTITEWEANAFCMNDNIGFGLSGVASLTAFQPFFVEPAMPYSTIRGEVFLFKGNVFNFLDDCIEIDVKLEESQDFKAEKLSPGNNSVRICANETQSYTWRITPQRLGMVNFSITAEAKGTELSAGRRDTVIMPLWVEPEGIKKEVTQSSLICVKGTPVSETITLNLPSNLVIGSEKASLYVLGDILGTAMKNAENLLPMPYGCAEQNIAMFLSHLYILFYLTDTKQLTEEKKSRILRNLNAGYQRQMPFRLPDGSFSTFGSREAEGNLWLTTLVYKAFGQSSPAIFVDENILNQALLWISSKQGPDGCFKSDGKIYNQALEDGADQNTILTAYITSSLLESNLKSSYPVVRAGLSCLDAASDGRVRSTFENALLAHTYGLAGNAEKQKHFLDVLMASATRNGGLLYWKREKRPRVEDFPSFYIRASSLEILMNSYVLLAWLNRPNLSQEDLTVGSQMARWLVRNQNSLGGFSSSQDTPVALLALSRFGNLTFTKDAENTVEISAGGSFKKVFQVTSSNSVLLQQVELPNIPGNYSVEVKGSGCVYIQTPLQYNIIFPTHGSGFALTVRTKNASCASNFLSRFDLELKARYTGERNASNMVIFDIKMLSGFVPVSSSLERLLDKVMRTETRNDHVFLYLESVSSKEITLTLTLEESHPVSKSKPATVRMFDYYETDIAAHSEYNTPCRQESA
uniref:LOW QUALITY PROTEIN: ovostatin-like n=1 Tax=Podarcis muralis TaxID=64176 RepID=UPI00109F178E|nr:LOW QUALITY PROTEIN: ovostatin-like [Podarcis muralis]